MSNLTAAASPSSIKAINTSCNFRHPVQLCKQGSAYRLASHSLLEVIFDNTLSKMSCDHTLSKMSRPIRVLCLHGWRTSGSILQRQTSALRQAFGSKAELVYIDAPWNASGPAPELVRSFYGKNGPFYQWWDALKRENEGEAYRYEGYEHSLDYLTGQVQALGTVDALLGFSQGAAVATLLTAHYQSTYGHVPWKACILVGGFYPRNPETQELLDAAKTSTDGVIDIPSVHVIGRADPLAPKSEKLFRSFTSSRRLKFEHDEGHKFPSPLKYKQMYHDIAQEVLIMTGQAWA